MKMSRLFAALCLLLLLGACASAPQSASILSTPPDELPAQLRLANIPFFPQEEYQCGPAALATVLVANNVETTAEELIPLVYVPGRQGSFQVELVAATRRFQRLAYELEPRLEDLLREVEAGHPVLVMQNLGVSWYPQWHFAVVKGFDLQRGEILLNSDVREDYSVSMRTFERTWARADHWAIVVTTPGELPATANAAGYFPAVVALENTTSTEVVAPAYAAGLVRWPTDRNLLMAYGNLLYGSGDIAAAASQFRTAAREHPDFAPAHNNLANTLHELGDDDQAMVHARKAVALGGEFQQAYAATLEKIRAATRQGPARVE